MASELTKALCAFHKDVSTIHKTAAAQYGKFADLATVLSTVIPPLAKNGLCVTQTFEPIPESEAPLLVTTLCHTSGESVRSELPMIIGKGRNALHDFGGSVTYLRRYSLLAIVGLAADVDTDGNLDEPAPATKSKPSPAPKPPAAKKESVASAPAPEPAPTTAAAPSDLPVDPDELTQLLQLVVTHTQRDLVMKEFREEFNLPADAKIKPAITSQAHATCLRSLILKHE